MEIDRQFYCMHSRVSTPTRKQKTPEPCKDVELEFSQRLFSLFTSFYDSSVPANDIMAFPPVKQTEVQTTKIVKSPARSSGFNSAIWDLRLKKMVEKDQQERESISAEIDTRLNDMELLVSEESEDLTDVFSVEKAPRPEMPAYLQNQERDRKRAEMEKKPKKETVNIEEAKRQFAIRTQKHIERADERREKMNDRMKSNEKSHRDFLKTLPKTRLSDDKVSTPTRSKGETTPRQSARKTAETTPRSITPRKSPRIGTVSVKKEEFKYYE